MGAPHKHTLKAKQQRKLDELIHIIREWYIDLGLPVVDVQKKLKIIHELDLSRGQINVAIRRHNLHRKRNTRSPRLINALKNKQYPEKICKFCNKIHKPTSGRQIFCSECVTNGSDVRRIRNYGVNRQILNTMLKDQNGKCDICEQEISDENINVDHDHATGMIRGILCKSCNIKLPAIEYGNYAINASLYLEKHKSKDHPIFVKQKC